MKKVLICSLLTMSACGVEPGEEPSQEDIAYSEQGAALKGCTSVCTSKDMIIGCDERALGANTKADALKAPYRSVGNFSNGCTGTLIGDRYVLTAAHCFDSNPTAMQFMLARHGTGGNECRPFGKVGVKRVFLPRAYDKTSGTPSGKALDLAVVELNGPIGGAVTLRFGHLSWSKLANKTVRTIGYPYDKPDGTVWKHTTGQFSFNIDQWINGGEKGILTSDTDGVGGQSGSPTYVFQAGKRKVVGVLLGSPIPSCLAGEIWSSRITPNIQQHINNAMDPQTLDFWWDWTDLQSSSEGPNC